MVPNKDQPKKEAKQNVARLAKVHRLNPYDDLSLIGTYAERFGQDPDWVYDNTSFGTIINFAIMWKETSEYNERFQHIWQEIHTAPTATPKKS